MPELKQIKKIEYIARILKTDIYQKRINGEFPKFSKIWKIEDLGDKQNIFLQKLSQENDIPISNLKLIYPSSDADSSITLLAFFNKEVIG